MRCGVVLCCLLFAGRALADSIYFEGYVAVKGEEEKNTKAQYVLRDGRVFELTLAIKSRGEEPLVISGLMAGLEHESGIAIYSADGKQRIGTGAQKSDDTLALDFSLLREGIKVGDVKITQRFDDDVQGLHLNFKLGLQVGEVSFEGNLPLDVDKTMRCSWSDDPPAPDC